VGLSPFHWFELPRVLVHFDHVASFILNAIGNSGRRARSSNGEFRIFWVWASAKIAAKTNTC